MVAIAGLAASSAHADEGGVSFWLPGQYGSFAAIAPSPGWSLPLVYYHYRGSIDASVPTQRGRLLTAGLSGSFDALFITPTYVPDTTILGARPSFSLSFAPAYSSTSADVGLGAASVSRSDSLLGGSDLYPTAQLYWNSGVHNVMAYVTGNVPVGSYSANRLSNTGIGHAAIDGGLAYTYLNTQTGTEFSATAGLTRNFKNNSTGYTNGDDFHLDLGAAQFLSENFFVGAVGYYYQQLTADRGQRPILGPNESRTRAIGLQAGYNFTVNGQTIYTNIRAYQEFDSYRRTEGYAVFFTVNIPISAFVRSSAH